jgi:hypothetical protein
MWRLMDELKLSEFAEFTEDGFRALLRQLKMGGYRFARYDDGENPSDDRHVLWRHDVDVSMHRAARLAEIEAEEDVHATYFVNLRCAFYNLLEPEIEALLKGIRALGHDIGLHFDTSAYDKCEWTSESLALAVRRERTFLEVLLEAPVSAMSWHNPELSNVLVFDEDRIEGLINAYSGRLNKLYTYCSDSNGYWRFKPMAHVIGEAPERLHLLTHPEWWTPDPLSPAERINRAVAGRASKVRRNREALLAATGRRNIW